MNKTFCSIFMSIAALLAACGGGSESAGSVDTSSVLSKYLGTYTFCDGHEKASLVITSADGRSLSMAARSDYYQTTGCAGAVVATEVSSTGLTATYVSTGSATVTGYPAAASVATYNVDRVSIFAPAATRSVTGSGVSIVAGLPCVTYTGGRVCIDTSPRIAQTVTGGLVFVDAALVLLTATATGYDRDSAYQRP